MDNEALFAQHKLKTEKKMKVVVVLLISVFVFTLYFLLHFD